MNQHDKAMNLLRQCHEGAYRYLQGRQTSLYRRAFYNCLPTCDAVDNNMCESIQCSDIGFKAQANNNNARRNQGNDYGKITKEAR